MQDILIIIIRTFILYWFILLIFRLMGKREVGELSIFDLVVFLLIAEVAGFSLDDPQSSFINAIVPVLMLFFIQMGVSYFSLKSKKFRDVMEGEPSILIRDGIIVEKEMRKQRYNLDDLLQQLREQQIGSIQSVSYAFLESSGNLSVFKKEEEQYVFPLIIDGEIQHRHLEHIGKNEKWLIQELEQKQILNYKKIFYCSYENENLYIQLKTSF
ncbi:DUF421 domain-containing protein [Psychrobacillus psychrodurans]|uniref:DUF421 domain-containing protein n=2 Tax=Bacillaceae TaxID=186817 RepID=UPI0008EC5952|nr:DUF421 domain-containing protein [Psychrobacillus psychrodurans]MCZ8542108.1 DUF421 domain-containing protein [Psychrobacillus psychrodurans]SFN17962.1 Uncharacterized membrane protein YcaP, DUF421 family [Psychrobacillus psychrodurans]